MIKRTLLLFMALYLTAYSPKVVAQFDDDSGNKEETTNGKDESAQDEKLEDKIDEKSDEPVESKDQPKNEVSDTFSKPEVSSADLKKLSDARKSQSESDVVRAASEILSKDPKNLQALNALGVFYFENKKFGLAKIILKRAQHDHPDEPALENNLGIIYLAEGDMRLALEAFRKSVELKATYPVGATNLSSIYLEFHDYQRSVGPLEASYNKIQPDLRRGQPAAVEVANNYGVAMMGIGENGKAERVFQELMESDNRDPVPLLNYAILLVEVLKKKKDAIRVISKLKFISEDREILRKVEILERKMGSS